MFLIFSHVLLSLPNGIIDNRSTGNGRQQFESKGDIGYRKTERLCLATESNQSQDIDTIYMFDAFTTGSLQSLYSGLAYDRPKMRSQVLNVCFGTTKHCCVRSWAAGHRTCGTASTERPCQARHLSPHHLHPECYKCKILITSSHKQSQVIRSSLEMGEVLPHEGKQPLRSCTSH